MDVIWLELLGIICLIALIGFFSASEGGVLGSRKSRIKELADEGNKRAAQVLAFQGNPERFLATVHVGAIFSLVLASGLAGMLGLEYLDPAFKSSAIPWVQKSSGWLTLGTIVVTIGFLVVVFGELVPRSLSLRSSVSVALAVAMASSAAGQRAAHCRRLGKELPPPVEGTYFLTRQEALKRRARPDLVFIQTSDPEAQLQEVMGVFNISPAQIKPLSRCSRCNEPLTPIPAFAPIYNACVTVLDLITGMLLYTQYRQLRERSFLALACGYLFTPLLMVAHTLTFPDAFGPGSLLGGPQSTAPGRLLLLGSQNSGLGLFPARAVGEPGPIVFLQMWERIGKLRLMCNHYVDLGKGAKWESGQYWLTPYKQSRAEALQTYQTWLKKQGVGHE